MSLYLGLDSSTQSISATLVDVDAVERGRAGVCWQASLVFDDVLPEYRTRHGVLPHDDPRVRHSSPRMWADALDRIFALLRTESGVDLSRLAAVSGSAQQHGTVYCGAAAGEVLASLDPHRPPGEQVEPMLTRRTAPIWMDASTTRECDEISDAVGAPEVLARITGSLAFARFSGPQIRKFLREDPDGYARTDRIHLVSSWLASLLAGAHAPLDRGDASGMNLMDLGQGDWSAACLDATAPDLVRRLPRIVPSDTVIGQLSPYWQRRHGLPPAPLVAWTGDNPSTIIGTGLVDEGPVAVSLGTSDTIFGVMNKPRVSGSGTGHVFGEPAGRFMGITVFANGSLARERVRDAYGLTWDAFGQALQSTPPGNHGALMLPWFDPEITPVVRAPGVHRRDLDAADASANVRAVVEGQAMALARHSRWMRVAVTRIHAAGGAAVNRGILQVIADVFGAPVHAFEITQASCLGAALRAWHAHAASAGRPVTWREVVDAFVRPQGPPVTPRPEARAIYDPLMPRQAAFEAEILARSTPSPLT